jgi:hypothetical protein
MLTFQKGLCSTVLVNNLILAVLEQEVWRFVHLFIIFSGSAAQRGLWPPRHTRFLDHTQRRATVGRTPLDE